MSYTDDEERETRRREAEEIARRWVAESAGESAPDRDVEDRALEALAQPRPPRERDEAIDGPRAEPPGGLFRRWTGPAEAEAQERVRDVGARLRQPGGDRMIQREMRAAAERAEADIERDRAAGGAPDPSIGLPDPSIGLPDPASARYRARSTQPLRAAEPDRPYWETSDEPPVAAASPVLDAPHGYQLEIEEPPEHALEAVAGDEQQALADLAAVRPTAPRSAARALGSPESGPDDRAIAALAGEGPAPVRGSAALELGDPSGRSTPPRAIAKPEMPSGPVEGGIPGAGDVRDAEIRDAIRAPFRQLSRALQMATGRTPGARAPSEADQLRARQDEMLGDKRQDLARQHQVARQERADRRAAADAEHDRALEDRAAGRADAQIELARGQASRQDRATAAQAARLAEQTAGEREARELAERRRAPGSQEAQRAQAELQSLVEALPPGAARDRVVEALVGPGARIDELSAEQIERIEQRLPEYLRATLRRSGAGGSGAGQARAQLQRALVDRGMSAEEAAAAVGAVGARRAAQSLITSSLAEGRSEGSFERREGATGGRRVEADTEALGRATDAALAWRQAIRAAQRVDPGLLRATFLSEQIPQGFTPEQVQSARSAVNRLRGELGHARSGAAISEHEFDRFTNEMGVAATSSPQAFRSWLQGVDAEEQERMARIRARFSDDVVRTYDERLRRERAPGAPDAPGGNRVPIILSDGRRATVPAENLDEAIRRGARPVQDEEAADGP